MYLVVTQTAGIVLHGEVGGKNRLRQRHVDILPGAFTASFSVFVKVVLYLSNNHKKYITYGIAIIKRMMQGIRTWCFLGIIAMS